MYIKNIFSCFHIAPIYLIYLLYKHQNDAFGNCFCMFSSCIIDKKVNKTLRFAVSNYKKKKKNLKRKKGHYALQNLDCHWKPTLFFLFLACIRRSCVHTSTSHTIYLLIFNIAWSNCEQFMQKHVH